MSHYFKNTDLDERIVKFSDTICGKSFNFTTDRGVFSKDHVDHLTKLLLEVIIDEIDPEKVLDFGCGYGVVGMCIAKYYGISVDMLDVNKKAVELAKLNLDNNEIDSNVFESDLYENVKNKYSSVILNPPIRAGKKVCYNIYEQTTNHLMDSGSLYIVISKKHGALSTIDYLKTIYESVEILYKKKGTYVIKSTK